MKDYLPRYTMRILRRILYKLRYISHYKRRSANKQLEHLVRQCISNFEKEHGDITTEMIQEFYSSPTPPRD